MRQALLLLLLTAATAQQTSPTAPPAFETASIHPAKLTNGCFSMLPPGGVQYAVTCVSLKLLIQLAYRLDHVEGGGPAVETLYDLRATAPDGKPWTSETIGPLLQQLLIERFHLAVHHGTRDLNGYLLAVTKSGSKLPPADPVPTSVPATAAQPAGAKPTGGQKAGEPSANFIAPGSVQGRSLNAKSIASLLGMALHAPVADGTGLPGTYNIDLRYAPESLPGTNPGTNPSQPADSTLPSFFTAVQEQLGLTLKPRKVPVETLVIDHVDPDPTAN